MKYRDFVNSKEFISEHYKDNYDVVNGIQDYIINFFKYGCDSKLGFEEINICSNNANCGNIIEDILAYIFDNKIAEYLYNNFYDRQLYFIDVRREPMGQNKWPDFSIDIYTEDSLLNTLYFDCKAIKCSKTTFPKLNPTVPYQIDNNGDSYRPEEGNGAIDMNCCITEDFADTLDNFSKAYVISFFYTTKDIEQDSVLYKWSMDEDAFVKHRFKKSRKDSMIELLNVRCLPAAYGINHYTSRRGVIHYHNKTNEDINDYNSMKFDRLYENISFLRKYREDKLNEIQ